MSILDPELAEQVAPRDWVNPAPRDVYDLVVIGGGPAGLVATAGACGLGLSVALVEKTALGGDCLVSGCVPSKFLLHAASTARRFEEARRLGWEFVQPPHLNFSRLMQELRTTRQEVSKSDAAARFQKLGADIFFGTGSFVSPRQIEVAGQRLSFRRAIVAIGSTPAIPNVPGLSSVPFLTSDNIFDLDKLPTSLTVLGGGSIGCELAQAFSRLGTRVTLLEKAPHLLPNLPPECGQFLRESFSRQGIAVSVSCEVHSVSEDGPSIRVQTSCGDFSSDHLLVATGRKTEVGSLRLENAGIEWHARGVMVDHTLRTSNPDVYAAGDICLDVQYTHAADASARVALQNAFFPIKKKWDSRLIGGAVFTDPEIVHIGQCRAEAEKLDWERTDRHWLSGEPVGFSRFYLSPGTSTIEGAILVGPGAAELSGQVAMVLGQRKGVQKLGRIIRPYPTHGEVFQKMADLHRRRHLGAGTKLALGQWFSIWRRLMD